MGKNETKIIVEKEKTKRVIQDKLKWQEINKFGLIVGGCLLILGLMVSIIRG